ncbi:SMC-Scp complex subunit ScpB [Congregibacter sp.]|uniref:SMC-Scp complex subunit ScpB n=1 Tax=Congregibacter sp. TaxID=2744308 RepID=UPI003F6C88F1
MTESTGLVQIIEAALLAAGKPLTVAQLAALFEEHERPANDDIRTALESVRERCEGRGFELVNVASGFRFQVREQLSPWIGRLWQERPQKYSRALMETLALVAYRQPITRGEIEEIRGVAVSTNIIRTLHERDWIRVVGHRDVPGRPAMYATTRDFLDYFNLKSLDQLPALADIRDLDTLNAELGFSEPLPDAANTESSDEQGEDDASIDGLTAASEDDGADDADTATETDAELEQERSEDMDTVSDDASSDMEDAETADEPETLLDETDNAELSEELETEQLESERQEKAVHGQG